jgi:hypothetical protein
MAADRFHFSAMAKLTYKAAEILKGRDKGPGVKRVRGSDGSYSNTVQSDSSTLSSDLGYVFKSNVKKVSGKR